MATGSFAAGGAACAERNASGATKLITIRLRRVCIIVLEFVATLISIDQNDGAHRGRNFSIFGLSLSNAIDPRVHQDRCATKAPRLGPCGALPDGDNQCPT